MINNKSILAIIPARGGSKGVPKKNIKLLNETPLIGYTLLEAYKSKFIDRVVVSTDDGEIAKVVKDFGGDVPYIRPKELSTDTSSTVECINHMVNYLKENEKYIPDFICLLQCTSPFRTHEDIDGAIEKIINTEFDGVISVCEVEHNPYWMNVFNGEKLTYFMEEGKKIIRRQELPKVYTYNGAIYIIKTDVFISEKSFETDNIAGYIMSKDKSLDIDTLMDFRIAEFMMKEREENAKNSCSYRYKS